MEKIELGWVVKDRISGIKGVVVSSTSYINFCNRLGIKPTGINKSTGLPYAEIWVDEESVEVVKKTTEYLPKGKTEPTGGPDRPVPPR